jgi:hypothetical protein
LFFPVVLRSSLIAGSLEQRRLRRIDAGILNELFAISRDPDLIGGNGVRHAVV